MKEQQLGQPKALYLLFFAELWERFGFYTVQALMVLYLTNSLNFSDTKAYNISSASSALLYAAPLIGGWLADRVLGFQRAIIFGFILYIIGYFLLDANAELAFYFSLALIITANGYFKANISSLLGTVYTENDPRRDRGFTIFYMGINIGSMIGPITAAIIQEHYGYHLAFAACGIGLLIGFIVFMILRHRLLRKHGLEPHGMITDSKQTLRRTRVLTYLFTLLAAAIICFILPHPDVTDWGLGFLSIIAIVYALYETYGLDTLKDKKHMIALIILIVYSVLFWAYYMQLFYSLTLFAERNVNRSLFGWVLPTASLSTFPNIFLVILSPFFVKLWAHLDKKKRNPSTGLKFALSMVFMSLSFLVINFADGLSQTGVITIYWLLLSGLVREVGEILISPIGLSAVTRLAPAKLTGAMMGLWFLAIGAALAIAGRMADISSVPKSVTSTVTSMAIYNHAFWQYAVTSGLIAIVSLFLVPFFNKLASEKMFN